MLGRGVWLRPYTRVDQLHFIQIYSHAQGSLPLLEYARPKPRGARSIYTHTPKRTPVPNIIVVLNVYCKNRR